MFHLPLFQMQFFFVSLQTDCSTLNVTQFLFTVMGLFTWLSWEQSGILWNLNWNVVLRRRQQGPSAASIVSILKTVENTGVRLMEEREATASASLSLVQYVHCVSKTTIYPFWTNYLFFTQCDIVIHSIMCKIVCSQINMFKMTRVTVNLVDCIKCIC